MWSLAATVMTDPGKVPPFYGHFNSGEANGQQLPYCKPCNLYKAFRSHHCSKCNVCVLCMDHHCFWVANCIGFYNRKSFILTLVYGILEMLILVVYNCWYLTDCFFFSEAKNWIGFTIWILNIIAIFVIGIFLKKHLTLLCKNNTTIEAMIDRDLNKVILLNFDVFLKLFSMTKGLKGISKHFLVKISCYGLFQ